MRLFQSTPSGGKATPKSDCRLRIYNVSIHAFRGEGDYRSGKVFVGERVSIHAFRGEGDAGKPANRVGETGVSIHAFRGEGDYSPFDYTS